MTKNARCGVFSHAHAHAHMLACWAHFGEKTSEENGVTRPTPKKGKLKRESEREKSGEIGNPDQVAHETTLALPLLLPLRLWFACRAPYPQSLSRSHSRCCCCHCSYSLACCCCCRCNTLSCLRSSNTVPRHRSWAIRNPSDSSAPRAVQMEMIELSCARC